jgi:hypothetical protein
MSSKRLNENIKQAQFRENKSSSSSSIFLDTTVSTPNIKHMINAVATIIETQLKEDMNLGKNISKESDLYYFCEEKYIELYPNYFDEKRKENIKATPSKDDIYNFIEALYNCVQFSPECCIIALIYINRIIALTGLSIQPTNWRPIIFVALMVSQKIWDDKYLSNGDFSYIYPFFEKNQLNTLEMKFLEMIQYNVFVKLSVYMVFYLELRGLKKEKIPEKQLNNFEVLKMEHLISKKKELKLKKSKSQGKFKLSGERGNYVIN